MRKMRDGNKTKGQLVRDITERKRTEQALLTSAQEWRTTFDTISDCVSLLDLKGEILRCNRAMSNLLRKPFSEIIGHICWELIHNASGPIEGCPFVRMRKTRQRETLSLLIDNRWFSIFLDPILDETGNVVGAVHIMSDITERKKAERELEKYRLISENTSDLVALTTFDLNVTYTYISPSHKRTLGYESEELIGKSMLNLINSEDKLKLLMMLRKYIESKTLEHFARGSPNLSEVIELRMRDKYGKWHYLQTTVNSIENELLFLSKDLTERKKMEEELARIEKLESLGILAGGIAHDFNNILLGILGNISLVKMSVDVRNKAEIFKILTEAEKACLRAKDLTQQLLTFSKGGKPVKKIASLGRLIKESISFALRGSNVRCEFSIPDDLWLAEIDEGQIAEVLNNVVINAEQAMPEGGIIWVAAENTEVGEVGVEHPISLKGGKYIKVSIKDGGIGIPQEHLSKIFDPFFTTKEKGSGLGLTTSYSIIRNHEGYIEVESELGVGTTITFYLPASPKEVLKKVVVEEGPIVGKGKILLMDDEETIRNLVKTMLTHLGYEIELAKDGVEAIELYKKAKETGPPFDVVIMDLTIPGGMGGKEAIEKLIEIDPEVKAIVSSGYSDDEIMVEFRKYGFSDAIAKPYKIQEMSAILHKVIATTGK
ncbi:MAG: PAS domain S-box protein [Candidatus Edwardsbacteria bacterium]